MRTASKKCEICGRIRKIRSGEDPDFIAELETGYLVLEDRRAFPGWVVFLCKEHVSELHLLDPGFRLKFLAEMALVSGAVFKALNPRKLNYELLGNVCPHLHWHIIPRYAKDPSPKETVWKIEPAIAGKKTGDTRLNRSLRNKILARLRKSGAPIG